MADGATVETGAAAPGRAGPALASLRFLVSGPLLLFSLLWAFLAFIVRPAMLEAHHGRGGAVGAWLRGELDPISLSQIAGAMQWSAFAGVIGIAAMMHARYVAVAKGGASERANLAIAAGYAVLMFAAYLLFIWGPTTVITLMMHDSFIFFDSTYRVLNGQTPSLDFPTSLGAASIWLPAFASWMIGGYGGSVELASALVALPLCLACAWAGAKRFPGVVTVMMVMSAFFITTLATLLGGWDGYTFTLLGETASSLNDTLTWAMFYNRWAWAALIAIFLFLTPTKEEKAPGWIDIGVIAGLLTFLFYVKTSYFAVGVAAALVFAWMNPKPLRTLAFGTGGTLALVLAIGLSTGVLVPYLQDVMLVAKVSGGRTDSLFRLIRSNLTELLLSTTPLMVLALVGRFSRRDIVVSGFIIVGSIFVINQNAQNAAIVSLAALGAYGVARVWSSETDRMARLAAMGSFLVLSASPILGYAFTVMDQVSAARREEARPASAWEDVPAMRGVYVAERESFLKMMEEADAPEERRQLLKLMGAMGRRMDLRQGEFMQVVLAGMRDLKPVVRPGDSIVTLDMSNPFPALMNARSAKGAWLTLHATRTISEDVHPDAATMFADADHVMIAKVSQLNATAELMQELYDGWLTAHYEQRVESAYWVRYSRRKAAR